MARVRMTARSASNRAPSRRSEGERFPRKAWASQVGPGCAAAQRDGAAVGMADQFFRRGVVESAGGIFGGIPAAAQRDNQQAGWTEQFAKDAERPLPALRRHVHPHGTQQEQIEPAPERAQARRSGSASFIQTTRWCESRASSLPLLAALALLHSLKGFGAHPQQLLQRQGVQLRLIVSDTPAVNDVAPQQGRDRQNLIGRVANPEFNFVSV